MFIINIITSVCLATLIAELIAVTISIAVKNRVDRIAFVRGFKKGKCAIIYFLAIPLYCVGVMYTGNGFVKAFFTSINKIIGLVVLNYDTGCVETLINDNLLYAATVYFCFILVGLNAILFTLSLTGQKIWRHTKEWQFKLSGKDRVIILGNNKKSVQIYKSADF